MWKFFCYLWDEASMMMMEVLLFNSVTVAISGTKALVLLAVVPITTDFGGRNFDAFESWFIVALFAINITHLEDWCESSLKDV